MLTVQITCHYGSLGACQRGGRQGESRGCDDNCQRILTRVYVHVHVYVRV